MTLFVSAQSPALFASPHSIRSHSSPVSIASLLVLNRLTSSISRSSSFIRAASREASRASSDADAPARACRGGAAAAADGAAGVACSAGIARCRAAARVVVAGPRRTPPPLSSCSGEGRETIVEAWTQGSRLRL